MRRSLSMFFVVTMVAMVFAGCFTDDDNGQTDDDGVDPGDPPNGDNNTTDDPWEGARIPPKPVIKVGLNADGENVTGPPFLVDLGANVSLTFDASESIVYQGGIVAVAWTVESERGWSGESQSVTFTEDLGNASGSLYGVYKVNLRILDEADVRGETTAYFAINYRKVVVDDQGFYGPGGAARDEPTEHKPTSSDTLRTGTYIYEQVTLGPNATAVNATLTFTPQHGSQMQLFLFHPDDTDTERDTDTADPLAESELGGSPRDLAYAPEDGNLTVGPYAVRADLDGLRIDDYRLEIIVIYTPPAPTAPDLSL